MNIFRNPAKTAFNNAVNEVAKKENPGSALTGKAPKLNYLGCQDIEKISQNQEFANIHKGISKTFGVECFTSEKRLEKLKGQVQELTRVVTESLLDGKDPEGQLLNFACNELGEMLLVCSILEKNNDLNLPMIKELKKVLQLRLETFLPKVKAVEVAKSKSVIQCEYQAALSGVQAKVKEVAEKGYQPKTCVSHDEFQKEYREIQAPFVEIVDQFEAKIKEENAKLKKVGISDDKLPNYKDEIQSLRNAYIDEVAKRNEALLYHENNREYVRGAGANNTFYTRVDRSKLQEVLRSGTGSIHAALAGSEAMVIQRAMGPGNFDGVGAMGGLVDRTRMSFPYFDVDKFNAGDEELLGKLRDDVAAKEQQNVPAFLVEATKFTIETGKLLIQHMENTQKKGDNTETRDAIKERLDDMDFDESGNARLITDPLEMAQNAAKREAQEESGELHGVADLLHSLATKAGEGLGQKLMGADDVLVDDAFLIRTGPQQGAKKLVQAVSPTMLGTECDPDDFNALKDGLAKIKEEGGSTSFVNDISHMETAGCDVHSMNVLRRRAGLTKNGKVMAEMISSDKAKYGQYAYRYVHEHSGTVLKLSMMQIAEALDNDSMAVQEALCRMAREDQAAVFDEDKRDHQINYLSSAKIMFKKDLKGLVGDALAEKAYELLAQEFGIKGVTAETIKAMDAAAKEVYDQRQG